MNFAPGAWRYAAPAVALAVPLAIVSLPLGALALALGGAVLLFYRDPARSPPSEGIVSPADGRVSVVREEDGRVRVGVFMNVTNVHVNRAPLSGTVETVTHSPGGHWPAFSKESDRNERLRVDCGEFAVVLIAGAVARRIRPYVGDGDEIERGDRIGHIAFGSRVDVLLPPSISLDDVRVEKREPVRAGETVIAPSRPGGDPDGG